MSDHKFVFLPLSFVFLLIHQWIKERALFSNPEDQKKSPEYSGDDIQFLQ